MLDYRIPFEDVQNIVNKANKGGVTDPVLVLSNNNFNTFYYSSKFPYFIKNCKRL